MVELLIYIPLLSLHLICMNVACGAPLLCIWLEWKARKLDAQAAAAANYLAAAGVMSLLAGSMLGLLMGWLMWTPQYASIWTERLAHKMGWGALEFLFSLGLMAGYWLWRKKRAASSVASCIYKTVLLLLASTNLLYHFPPLFLIAGRLVESAPTSGEVKGRIFVREMLSGEVPALWIHFTLASLAMGGIMLLGLALRMARRGGDAEAARRVAMWGGYWGLVPSILNLPVGLWVIASLKPSMQGRIMGGSSLATIFFLAGIVAALWLLRDLVAIAMGETARQNLIRAMSAMVVVVVLMTGAQQLAKERRTAPARGMEGVVHAD